jgi:hypothetical protein
LGDPEAVAAGPLAIEWADVELHPPKDDSSSEQLDG